MKKIYLVFLAFTGIISTFSQTQITLTFQARDSVSQNTLDLDSVRVTNLSEDCDTSLYDAISILTLDATWPVGIGQHPIPGSGSFILAQNVPNPFRGSTLVKVFMKQDGELNLLLFDNLGRTLAAYGKNFEKGWHLFAVSAGGPGMLFLNARDGSNSATIRIVSSGGGSSGERISYNGSSGQGGISLKSAGDETGFIFYLGNDMSYTAYAEGYHATVIYDNPVSSEVYTFSMLPLSLLTIPSVSTSQVTDITQTTAISGGDVTYDGGATVTARGVCWGTSPNPTTAGNHTTDGSGTGTFVSSLSGLTPGTPYYIRAYAVNSEGTAYGNELSFSTLPIASLPVVTTTDVTSITPTTATSGGNVTSDGGANVTVRGVCWSTTANPTIAGSHTTDGSGTGIFISYLNGLTPSMPYFIRAYATNSAGTAYGNELTFTTTDLSMPTVTTTAASNITQTSATSGGNVISDGGAFVTARGVCWSTTSNPSTAGNHTTDGSGTGVFVSNLSGLTANTPYYIRAYATNSVGTAYGTELTFSTIPVGLPTVITSTITNITQTTATGGGNVTCDGGITVTARGVCWSTSPAPTTAGNHTTDGSGPGSFVSNLTGLAANTLYYVRAYAINSMGTAYGNEESFTTTFACGDLVSYGGQNYNTVLIGTQCWFRDNLNIGIMLNTPAVPTNNGIIEKHCFNNDPANCTVYGGLYYWDEVMQYVTTSGTQGICPAGWHVPTDGEYTTLVALLGGNSVAGGAMKETGTVHWLAPNGGATNSSGFTALGAGALFYGSQFSWFNTANRLSTSSVNGTITSWYWDMNSQDGTIERLSTARDHATSVRCIKN